MYACTHNIYMFVNVYEKQTVVMFTILIVILEEER